MICADDAASWLEYRLKTYWWNEPGVSSWWYIMLILDND